MTLEKNNPQNIHNEAERMEKVGTNVEQTLEGANIERVSGESRDTYLWRAGEMVRKKMNGALGTPGKRGVFLDRGGEREKDLPEDVIAMIEHITFEALKPQQDYVNLFKNEKAIEGIERKVDYHDKDHLVGSGPFDTTNRTRKFFETQSSGQSRKETYWNTLFFPYNTKSTRELAKRILDGKTVVLLGGGRSQLKKELSQNDITPSEVINIDPFVENVEEGADKVIPLSATSPNFMDRMNSEGIVKADEIWAEYSVPAYLSDPGEISQLFKNIDVLLAEGGTARIWPLQVGKSGEDEDRIPRKNALVDSIKEINATGKYEIILYQTAGRHGVTLHKLDHSRENLRKASDEERIRQIKNQLGINP